ncbi:hypothetical protein [uncultured Anaerococcus sp.]|uniref:MurR/RpiR family transcriptional regulator n=1 Tax=uncultured Anaerococcus sp. TaxID=293428 RepID=UPI00288941E7|nr:hypothetical protein [uncultured Anaerococcus sp.]
MNVLKSIAIRNKNVLSESDFQIIELLEDNISKIPTSTISEIADITFTSNSTLFRLVKKIGFKSYNDFKYWVRNKLNSEEIINENFNSDFIRTIINNLEWTDILSNIVTKNAAHEIINSDNLYFYATGWKQNKIGESFIADLNLYDIHFETIRSIEEFEKIKLNGKSLILIISYRGNLNNIKNKIIEL